LAATLCWALVAAIPARASPERKRRGLGHQVGQAVKGIGRSGHGARIGHHWSLTPKSLADKQKREHDDFAAFYAGGGINR
jgi:hypothetical protein